jgi:hypothetical protein
MQFIWFIIFDFNLCLIYQFHSSAEYVVITLKIKIILTESTKSAFDTILKAVIPTKLINNNYSIVIQTQKKQVLSHLNFNINSYLF